jgi:peptidoglycan-associated lipoprotein
VEFVNEDILFAFDSSALTDQTQQILNNMAEYLRTNPRLTATVAGHCDERGTNAYNIALGERRANSVKNVLVSMGIGADRLNTVSYGEEHPVAPGRDKMSWAKNRRAQLVIN